VDRDDSGNARTEANYLRIKILTEEGRSLGNVQIAFLTEYMTVSNVRARTIRPDGSIVNFDGKVYESAIVKGQGVKYLAKTFTMPEVCVGGIIEYRFNYDFSNKWVVETNWELSGEDLFTRRAKFSLKPCVSPGALLWKYPGGLPEGTQPPVQSPDHVFRMSVKNIPAFPTEDFIPPEYELKYSVVFFRTDEMPEEEPDKFWRNFDKKKVGQIEGFVDQRKAMEEAVGQILAASDAADVKLRKIYDRAQQVQNLSYETRKTEQEEKREKIKTANNGSLEDWGRRSRGNRLVVSGAGAGCGIGAGLASPRDKYFFQKQRMSTWEVDAPVVLVKLNGKYLFFDPGTPFTPMGLLPWQRTGVQCLQLDKEGGEWMDTAMPDSGAARVERTADLKLRGDGSLEGKLKVAYRGQEALSLRLEERNKDDVERRKFLEDQVKEAVPAGIEVQLTNQPNWSSSEFSLVAEFSLKVPGWASSTGHRTIVPSGLFVGSEKHLFEHSDRVLPVYLSYGFKKIDNINIQLPKGWSVEALPKPIHEDAKAVEFSLRMDDLAGNLNIRPEVRCDLMLVPRDKYGVLRSFYQTVRADDQEQIVVMPANAAASN
jgi:hypothetical protein